MKEIKFDDLPGMLQAEIKETVGEPDVLYIERVDDFPVKGEEVRFTAFAVTPKRYTMMTWTGPDEANTANAYTRSTLLKEIFEVEIGNTGGTIHVHSDEGDYETGVPEVVARAIIKLSGQS